MIIKLFKTIPFAALALAAAGSSFAVFSQTNITVSTASSARYIDNENGMTEDRAVAAALEHNGEILALRSEVEAARSLVKQAGLRPNPKVSANGSRQIGGMDNSMTFEGTLPLELGGRRGARVRVAEAELEIRELALANQERLLAAEVRTKFSESLAATQRLDLIEKIVGVLEKDFVIIETSVSEGRIAPLEKNMFLVELNRLRSLRETVEGKTESAMFELRNLIGMNPEEPMRLKGVLHDIGSSVPVLDEALSIALAQRPDLLGARSTERLAEARMKQAQSEGRIDASLKSGYQRMNSGFPVSGFDNAGELRPVQAIFKFYTFGVEIDLPVRNRNQGAVEAAAFDQAAARRRVEFGELTIRREVSSAFARYNRAARALAIFHHGVRDQADANLQVIWQTYQLGKRDLSDYISEERRFLDIENELINAEHEAHSALIEIYRAVNAPELKR